GEWANVRVCPSRKTALEYGRGKPLPYGEIRNSTKNMVFQQHKRTASVVLFCITFLQVGKVFLKNRLSAQRYGDMFMAFC
ncbi:MAG: hypothetical protein SPD47_07645, partial [Oscillospiraceae bacterium]|nr:hypothetical protein [Oscillospiraceae bacterium]